MQEHSGASVDALAKAAGANRSIRRTPAGTRRARGGDEGRRRSLAAHGRSCGRSGGPSAGAPVDLTAAPEADRSDAPPPPAPSRWVRALACYERKEPHEFQMSRYG